MSTVLLTGANRGLGLEFVRQYAADGWDVLATCRHPEKADALNRYAAEHPTVKVASLDVTESTSIEALAERWRDIPVDVLINNAGVLSGGASTGPATQTDPGQEWGGLDAEAWVRAFRANTVGPALVTEAFLPNVRKSQGRKIVMVSTSMSSLTRGQPGFIAYRSTKAALNMVMRTLAAEVTSEGLVVVSLHPGWVQTDMGGMEAELRPEESVRRLRRVIEGLTLADSGAFLDNQGGVMPW